ncbi:uncharacterized protein DS421_16g529730 [Arachis hypogaea]|nr:uncharacterized protein DS421_16g529730 [Arachis hypogaea]
MNVSNTLLKELLDRFDEEKGCLKTLQGKIYITPRKVADALSITNEGNHFPEKVDYNNLNPADKECAGYECRRGGEPEKIQEDFCCLHTKVLLAPHNAKDNAAKRRKRALEMIREKRSKKRNDGAQSANIASDQFDSPKAQNEFSQTVPAVSLDSEQFLQTQESFTPSVNAASNTNCPPEPEKQGDTVSLTSYVIEDLFKDDYVYEVSNEDPAKEQQQQSKEPPVTHQSEQEAHVNVRPLEQQEQPCEEPTAHQSKQEAPVDVYPQEPKKQDVTVSLTSSIIEEFFKDDDVYEIYDEKEEQQYQEPLLAWKSEQETLIFSSFNSAAQPRKREDERPSFNFGISPSASQPSQPSQLSVSQLEIMEEAVVDARVIAALNFAEATTSEPTLPASEVVCIYSMILNEIKVRRYQELIYIVPLDIVNFMLETHGESYVDKSTNKAYRFDIEQYAHHRQFLDKRKLASHPFLFVPICNGAHLWLWIVDVNKKKFYVLDPINKLPENIPNSRKTPNKFVGEIDSFRYQYGPHILLYEMNKIRDQVIWESEAIILPKPSAALSSPYCKFTSGDLDSK